MTPWADAESRTGEPSLTERLVQLLGRPVGPAARRTAALHVLDWIGTVWAASVMVEGRAFCSFGCTRMGGPSVVAGCGRHEAEVAALVNGSLAMSLEFDDLHMGARVHPGPVVISAALACAEREGVTGERFLDAVVRGYEAVIRLGYAFGPGHRSHWHSTATCGCLGAAAAAASLMGLDAARAVDAIGNAGTQASGLWQCRLDGALSKPLHAGRAAQSGLLAADLALHGLTGPFRILEGEHGMLAAMCPDPAPEALLADPEADWLIGQTAFKAWPSCAYTHSVIEAVLDLRRQVAPEEVGEITVTTYPEAIEFADCAQPATASAARFSIQHCAAVAWLSGGLALEDLEPARIDEPAVRELRRRVNVRAGSVEGCNGTDPWGAEVVVADRSGRGFSAVCRHPRGMPENPLSAAAIEAKSFSLLLSAGLPEDCAHAVIASAIALAAGGSVGAVTEALE